MKKAVYAGSFDPITSGHEAVINAASKMFDLTVIIATNKSKKHLFNSDERLSLVNRSTPPDVKVVNIDNMLLAEYCKMFGIDIIVRGLRNINDLEYELQIASVNSDLCKSQTVFIPAPQELSYISSSMVKEVAFFGGDTSKYVNSLVKEAMIKKFTS